MPDSTRFLYANGKRLDGQYRISRILQVGISDSMNVVAKNDLACSRSSKNFNCRASIGQRFVQRTQALRVSAVTSTTKLETL